MGVLLVSGGGFRILGTLISLLLCHANRATISHDHALGTVVLVGVVGDHGEVGGRIVKDGLCEVLWQESLFLDAVEA